ncbi:MAG: hypothetical protein ACQERB_15480 [Promethearchaeati archaeon]
MNKDNANINNYSLKPFLSNLSVWVDQFRIRSKKWSFSVKRNGQKTSLYGLCDMVFNLKIPNKLDEYLSKSSGENLGQWISNIQLYQNPKTGWFKEGLINYGMHFKEHSTAFSVAALKLLGSKPLFDFKITKRFTSKKKVFTWLEKAPEWGLLYWAGSHRGGGIGAIYATLGEEYYPHEKFFEWYFEWLDKKADPELGFWRLGWIHRLNKNRLTKNELGGAVHYYWIYEFMNHPIPYPKRVIDSTLALQNKWGTWDTHSSYCIDLDAIFCLTRCNIQTEDYREDEIRNAIIKYLHHVVKNMNDKKYFLNNYKNTHKLTGFLCAIAEINKSFPELLENNEIWTQTLDITPWI